jgi:hypothetical protein
MSLNPMESSTMEFEVIYTMSDAKNSEKLLLIRKKAIQLGCTLDRLNDMA